jgi:hypothetical protein
LNRLLPETAMIGPQHLPFLITYFNGIDAALSGRLLRSVPPDEPALTNELCALMDAETQRREKLLEFNIDRLNAALAACGDDMEFDIRIDTHPHNPKMEAFVSQSDLGLIIEYQNHVLPSENWFNAYLLQAKRLHRADRSGQYDDRASFKSVDHRQHDRLEAFAKRFGEEFFGYILYCPPVPHLTADTATKVRALHTRNLSRPIYDYVAGLSLFDYLKKNAGRIDAGIWLTPVTTMPSRILNVHADAFEDAIPFSWFFLQHLTSPTARPHRNRGRLLPHRDPDDERARLIRDVVSGDSNAIEEFLRVADGEVPLDLPEIAILPKSTITITVSVGSSLPADTRRAILQ